MSAPVDKSARRVTLTFSARPADRKLLADLKTALGGAGRTAIIRQALREAAERRRLPTGGTEPR